MASGLRAVSRLKSTARPFSLCQLHTHAFTHYSPTESEHSGAHVLVRHTRESKKHVHSPGGIVLLKNPFRSVHINSFSTVGGAVARRHKLCSVCSVLTFNQIHGGKVRSSVGGLVVSWPLRHVHSVRVQQRLNVDGRVRERPSMERTAPQMVAIVRTCAGVSAPPWTMMMMIV